ncbi:MAG: insulinase family protein [Gemmatimonadales bacterium]
MSAFRRHPARPLSTETRRGAILLLILGTTVGPVVGGAQDFPTTPPAPGNLTPATLPPARETVLPNGLRLLIVENRRLPVLSLTLAFPAGRFIDPAGKEGLAAMAAGLLTKGAGLRSAEQVSEAIENVGGAIGAGAGQDFLSLQATVLSAHAALAFDLVGDAVARPAFKLSEIDLLRTQTLSGIELERSQPNAIAARHVERILYGEHPYARRATKASVERITRTDLIGFHRARLRPRGALLVVAGDISVAEARRHALRAFRGWLGGPLAPPVMKAPPTRTATEITLVHRPGSVQSNVVVANLTYPPGDPRHHAAVVANRLLGEGADSRLFSILREQKGWTYGAYSSFSRRRGTGKFEAATEVRSEVTDSALAETMKQLRRLRDEPVPPDELDRTKAAIVGSYPLMVQTAQQIADAVADVRLYGLPGDYLETYRLKIGAVTAEAFSEAAKVAIRPDAAVIVVVGDGTKILAGLKAVAPVTLIDAEGAPLTEAELSPKAERLPIDVASLVATHDSFSVRVQGNPLGRITSGLEPRAAGFRYTEHSNIGGFVEQTTTVDFDRDGGVTAVKQDGKVQGQPTSIEVSYAAGRVRGSANTVSPEGAKSVTVDTVVAAGTIDDNAIQPLLPALPWTPTASWSFAVFSAGQNESRVTTLRVVGTEAVKLDSGTVDSYKIEWSGGWQPATFWVSVAKPHRLVKIGITNTPVEIVRAK